jgi:hypothetical protein
MMPPTATIEVIKAHQLKVEKDKIPPENLPPCPRCSVESDFFKIHAYRERRFLIIIEMLIRAAFCTLVRFRCPGCGKTFTDYPDFAIPHKHYTRPTVLKFSGTYLEDDQKTYKDVVMTVDGAPTRSETDRQLAPSTIHRWISTLAGIFTAYQAAKEKASSGLCKRQIPKKKYRTLTRREVLLKCWELLGLSPVERINVFSPSLQ